MVQTKVARPQNELLQELVEAAQNIGTELRKLNSHLEQQSGIRPVRKSGQCRKQARQPESNSTPIETITYDPLPAGIPTIFESMRQQWHHSLPSISAEERTRLFQELVVSCNQQLTKLGLEPLSNEPTNESEAR